MPKVNERWAARVLNLNENPGRGPDLLGFGKFVEVKFCLLTPTINGHSYPKAWTVQEHQLEYEEFWTGLGFWAFGLYALDRPVKSITTNNMDELESMVTQRELFITPWSFVYEFEPHKVSGKTKYSEWEDTFRYPKHKYLPKVKKTYEVEKGLVHITRKVPEYMFEIKTSSG
jgi:hypothetical protein